MARAVLIPALVGLLVSPALAQTPATPAPPAQITVTGAVQHPGVFAWRPGLTIADAIALAGGLTDRASGTFSIKKQVGTRMLTRPSPQTATVEAGDSVDVPVRYTDALGPRVIVLGAVKTPGTYTLGASRGAVAAAIAAAGGTLPTASDDVQVWNRIGGRGGPPIGATTSPAEVLISHYSLRALGGPGPGITWDDTAVYVPNREAPATSAGRVIVKGDVAKPGEQTLPPDRLTVSGALEAAGGVLPTAYATITIRRAGVTPDPRQPRGQEFVPTWDSATNASAVVLRDGDTIEVPQSTRISVERVTATSSSGRVMESSGSGWSAGLTVGALLDRMPPTGPTAAPGDLLQVRRRVNGQIMLLPATTAFVLQPNDVVVITVR